MVADMGTERGRESRLAEVYVRSAPAGFRLAYLLTGDRTLAEDLVQEAFVKLAGRFRDLRSEEAFPWYLRRTVVNLANSHFRRVRVERAYLAKERGNPERHVEIGGGAEMWAILQDLPVRQRAAIALRYYEDLTEAQTAEVLRCPVGTVKSLVSRGIARLRADLSRGG